MLTFSKFPIPVSLTLSTLTQNLFFPAHADFFLLTCNLRRILAYTNNMPHVSLVCMSGFRVREQEMFAVGMTLPGLASRAGAVGALPGLGLLTLAGLTPPSWSVSYHEAPRVTDELVRELLASGPLLVGISALTASIVEAYELCRRLRAAGVRTVIGGLHATSCPDEAAKHADAVVAGDGEPVWAQVLDDCERGALRGIYRAAAPFDLRLSPLPRFDLLGNKARPRFTMQTARGCPLACEFCGASRLLGPFREKPIERIREELSALSSLARRPMIELADDNTFAGKRDASELLRTLERSGARYFTEVDWRVGERADALKQLAASGCVQVLVGIESIVHAPKGMGAKAAPLTRIMNSLANIQEAGVAVIGCFIVGADGETYESMQQLGEFLIDAPLADVQLTLQTPFPGTALHERLRRENRLLSDRGWESYTLFDLTYVPTPLSAPELEAGFRNLVKYVFAPDPSRRRMEIRQRVWAKRYGDVS